MPFTNAKLYRKKSGKSKSTRKRSSVRTKSIATIVRKEIKRTAETKHFVQSFVDLTLDQRLETANQQAFLFQPSQGPAQDERIGNKVFLKGIAVKGVYTVMSNMDYPHYCRIAAYKLKNSMLAPSSGQLDSMMTLGSTSTHLGETLINTLRPFNKDMFTIVKSKSMKMAKVDHNAGTSNNDYKFTIVVKWWIPINRTIIFDESNALPQNWGLYFGGVSVRADGQVASPQSAVVKYSQDMVYYYTDI